jgi:hypothetical protein
MSFFINRTFMPRGLPKENPCKNLQKKPGFVNPGLLPKKTLVAQVFNLCTGGVHLSPLAPAFEPTPRRLPTFPCRVGTAHHFFIWWHRLSSR